MDCQWVIKTASQVAKPSLVLSLRMAVPNQLHSHLHCGGPQTQPGPHKYQARFQRSRGRQRFSRSLYQSSIRSTGTAEHARSTISGAVSGRHLAQFRFPRPVSRGGGACLRIDFSLGDPCPCSDDAGKLYSYYGIVFQSGYRRQIFSNTLTLTH